MQSAELLVSCNCSMLEIPYLQTEQDKQDRMRGLVHCPKTRSFKITNSHAIQATLNLFAEIGMHQGTSTHACTAHNFPHYCCARERFLSHDSGFETNLWTQANMYTITFIPLTYGSHPSTSQSRSTLSPMYLTSVVHDCLHLSHL